MYAREKGHANVIKALEGSRVGRTTGATKAAVSIPASGVKIGPKLLTYEETKDLLNNEGIATPTVYFPQSKRRTDPKHPHEELKDHMGTGPESMCWQCQYINNIQNFIAPEYDKLVCIAGGGPGCAWEREFIKAQYPTKYKEQAGLRVGLD